MLKAPGLRSARIKDWFYILTSTTQECSVWCNTIKNTLWGKTSTMHSERPPQKENYQKEDTCVTNLPGHNSFLRSWCRAFSAGERNSGHWYSKLLWALQRLRLLQWQREENADRVPNLEYLVSWIVCWRPSVVGTLLVSTYVTGNLPDASCPVHLSYRRHIHFWCK